MTLAQVWKKEGIQEGQQLGMQKTLQVLDLLQANISMEEIMKMTDISHAEILAIKKRLPH